MTHEPICCPHAHMTNGKYQPATYMDLLAMFQYRPYKPTLNPQALYISQVNILFSSPIKLCEFCKKTFVNRHDNNILQPVYSLQQIAWPRSNFHSGTECVKSTELGHSTLMNKPSISQNPSDRYVVPPRPTLHT